MSAGRYWCIWGGSSDFAVIPHEGSPSEVSEIFHTPHSESVPVAQGMCTIGSLSDSIVQWIGDKSYIKEQVSEEWCEVKGGI